MKRKLIKSLLSAVSSVLCVVLVFNVFAFATQAQPENIWVKSIEINEIRGVLKGKEETMTAESDGGSNSLRWGTSNKYVISCTERGVIKGIQSGMEMIK